MLRFKRRPQGDKKGTGEEWLEENPSFRWKFSVVLLLLCILSLQVWQLVYPSHCNPPSVVQEGASKLLLTETGNGTLPETNSSYAVQSPTNATDAPAAATATPSSSSPAAYVPPSFAKCDLKTVGGRAKDKYGAWPLCLNHVPAGAIVYSIGIGLDISFDKAMVKRGAKVFGFDPTVKPAAVKAMFGAEAKEMAAGFSFMQVGLGAENGVVTFLKSKRQGIQSMTAISADETTPGNTYADVGYQAAVLTLSTMMAALKHDHVDLLKVDVEGLEFDVCDTRDFQDAVTRVGQLIYEFHTRLLKDAQRRKERCVQTLARLGFKLVTQTGTEEHVFARIAQKPGG